MFPKYNPEKERAYWDCSIDRASEKKLAAWAKAMISCQGQLCDSYAMCDPTQVPWGGQSIFMRISLPVNRREDFEKLTSITLKHPPVIRLN